ncbi:MAG TPA: hypothetical protein VFX16_24860 [Pseudonocardiaceae bacterium]|nr:hypothetical protein [Pseudonocardiaceae bacterium]
MDRPSNGHRRHDAGSITVVDLIRRQQAGPIRIPSADEAATVQFMDDLLGGIDTAEHADHRRSWLAKGAKLAGLALGSLALCGSVYAASTLTQHRPQATATTSDTAVLTGVGALRPDTVAAQLSGSATPPTTKARPGIATGRATGTVVGKAAAPPATTAPQQDALPPRAGLVSAADVVRAFYRLVATDPSLAQQLISPALLSTDNSGFDRAWSSLGKIDIESVRQTSANTAEAVVRMLEPDGTWLRVVELVHVTDGDEPLINGAELLSAQRG